MNIRPIQKEQEARRLRAIEAIQQGFSQTHVAAMLGITSASVSNWKLRFRSGGVQDYWPSRAAGPPAVNSPARKPPRCSV